MRWSTIDPKNVRKRFLDALFFHFPWDLQTFSAQGPIPNAPKRLFGPRSFSKGPDHALVKVLSETPCTFQTSWKIRTLQKSLFGDSIQRDYNAETKTAYSRSKMVHWLDSTLSAHHIFSCTVVAQSCFHLLSESTVTLTSMHSHGSSHEAHCQRFARKHEHLIFLAQ